MSAPGDPAETGATVSPWRGAGPELVIAGVVIVVAAVAGYVLAGWAGLSVAVTAGAAVAMVVLRYLLPTPTPDAARKAREKPQARLLSGYSHRRFVVHSSIASRGFYQGELRPVLEHLLAARLARLAFLANFLSRTVLVGFLTGVGIQVAAGQLPDMLGVTAAGSQTSAPRLRQAAVIGRAGTSASFLAAISGAVA